MNVYNPLDIIKDELLNILHKEFSDFTIEELRKLIQIERPPRNMGDISLKIFRLSERIREKPSVVVKNVGRLFRESLKSLEYIEKFDSPGIFLNFWINVPRYGDIVYRAFSKLGSRYGFVPAEKVEKIIVEHTSANPIHPLHIGHLRNSLLGDSISRLLEMRGHKVSRHFYIDDTGLQVAYAAYGYSKVKGKINERKPDHLIGIIYSITTAIVTIQDLKKKIEEKRKRNEDVTKLNNKLSEWLWIAEELREKYRSIFDILSEKILEDKDALKKIYEINRRYEEGDIQAFRLIRDVTEKCIEGFKQTFERLDIAFDSWDWESELTVWNGLVEDVIEKLKDTGLVFMDNGALVFAADKLAEYKDVREELLIPKNYEVLPLVLKRSDGTTLYTTRDIAYSLWKFKRAEKTINVIAVQQTLAQMQIRLALYALGAKREAKNLIHYSYEMVRISGKKMSSRRGKYVAADDLIDEAISRSLKEIEGRISDVNERKNIAEKVGIGAIKYFFLNVSPNKVLTFDWSRVLDFNQNSGPFVQYSYVRAKSILRKAEEKEYQGLDFNPEGLGEEERNLIVLLGEFPETVKNAADKLRPDFVALYLNTLAMEFNRYYDTVPILMSPNKEKLSARLGVVRMVSQTLKNGMYLLGFSPPEKM